MLGGWVDLSACEGVQGSQERIRKSFEGSTRKPSAHDINWMWKRLTLHWGEVTRVGKPGYFSWISLRRYSTDWELPHGILCIHVRPKDKHVSAFSSYIPFCVAHEPFPAKNGNYWCRCSIERDDQSVLCKGRIVEWLIVVIERHDWVHTICQRGHRVLLKHEFRCYYDGYVSRGFGMSRTTYMI